MEAMSMILTIAKVIEEVKEAYKMLMKKKIQVKKTSIPTKTVCTVWSLKIFY